MNTKLDVGDNAEAAWIQTYSGDKFTILDPKPEQIHIIDIAHALSMMCRFTGHVRDFYSVAQHSYLVSVRLSQEGFDDRIALWGLMHDASEAYICDMSRPLKIFSVLGVQYRVIEARIMAAICDRFSMDPMEPAVVKEADGRMLATEKRDLMAPTTHDWAWRPDPYEFKIVAMSQPEAELKFLQRFTFLSDRIARNG